jgi:hypothetical protein
MLPNILNQHNIQDLNIDISSKVLGKKIIVDKKNKLTFNDEILDYYKTVNKIDLSYVTEDMSKMLNILNFKSSESFADLIPQNVVDKSVINFKNLILNSTISEYFFSVLKQRYELTDKIKDSKYDHITSVTGRMKIISGKNHLITKKEKRKEIEILKNNTLLEIDIKSCEPALLHAVLYNETPEDIYSFFGKDVPRDKTKIAVISSIYGAEPKRVKKLTGLSLTEIKNIHDHFKLKKIKEVINKSFKEKGYFRNLYGRPIKDNSSPVNYWVQSSAADYSCLAFLDLINRGNFKLKACIHDAVILELTESQKNSIKNIDRIYDPVSNIKLRVEQTIIK